MTNSFILDEDAEIIIKDIAEVLKKHYPASCSKDFMNYLLHKLCWYAYPAWSEFVFENNIMLFVKQYIDCQQEHDQCELFCEECNKYIEERKAIREHI